MAQQKESKKQQQVDCQEVARVAYQFYERRGRQNGHDVEDWLKAEEALLQRGLQKVKK